MALREKIMSNARPFLDDGESIEAVFVATATNPWWSLLGYWFAMVKKPYRAVVVTDQRILLCQNARFKALKIEGVKWELPRSTRIGPATGTPFYRCDNLGEPLWIHRGYRKDVDAADSLIEG